MLRPVGVATRCRLKESVLLTVVSPKCVVGLVHLPATERKEFICKQQDVTMYEQ
jgi:hypothetical protein